MARQPNIILIVLDTARAKNFSTYGYERETTPNIDRIAGKSVVYRNCFSPAPWTTPSHVSLFTGLYPHQHGVNSFLQPSLPEEFMTLQQILKYSGYRTYGMSSNRLISEGTGFSRGFDFFRNPFCLYDDAETRRMELLISRKGKMSQARILLQEAIRNGHLAPAFKAVANYMSSYYADPLLGILTAAIKFGIFYRGDRYLIDTTPLTLRTLALSKRILMDTECDKGKPFFLFMNFLQNHTIYNPPGRFRNVFVRNSKSTENSLFNVQLRPRTTFYTGSSVNEEEFDYLRGLYDEETLFMDSVIGELYYELEQLDLEDDTLLIITSDHGEHIGEKGHFTHFFSLYNELLHVPLIVKYPKGVASPRIEDRLVQTHDVFATIMDIAGSPIPPPESSVSLLGNSGREVAISQFFYDKEFYFKKDFEMDSGKELKFDLNMAYQGSLLSVVSSRLWKLIQRADGTSELYNLQKDFYENDDLSADKRHQDIRCELERIISSEGLSEWLI